MAIAFAYTVATNTVVVTGGTSGTPATFADFVTADRAGTGTSLKAATAASLTLTLTYPIRPVELLALIVKLIVASKTTATAYIHITGTDAWDAAQTETIDVSAGNGTYTSTKRWRTITNIRCDDSDGGTGTVWADGTLAVTQDIWGVIWNKGNSQYSVGCLVAFGDGTTSTYFKSTSESVSLTVHGSYIHNAATLHLLTSRWSVYFSAAYAFGYGALTSKFIMEGSYLGLVFSGVGLSPQVYSFTLVYNSIIAQETNYSTCGFIWRCSPYNNHILDNLYIKNLYYGFWQESSTMTSSRINAEGCYYGIYSNPGGTATITKPSFVGATVSASVGGIAGNNVSIIDSQTALSTVTRLYGTDPILTEKYTCNINVCDKDGVAISGVVVDCETTGATAVWTAGTVTTDASGNIAEQLINYRKWSGASFTLETYSPHKFTISKAGYQTLVMEAITVSAPIKWHVELQAPSVDKGAMLYDIDKGKFVRILSDKTCLSF